MLLSGSKVDTSGANIAQPMEIMGVDGKPLTENKAEAPVLMLTGRDGSAYRGKFHELLARAAVNQKDGIELTPEENEARTIELLEACTLDFRNIEGEESIADVYRKYPAVRDQADKFIADRANHLKKS